MSKQSDTLENMTVSGNITILAGANPDNGLGNVECAGVIYADVYGSNTTGVDSTFINNLVLSDNISSELYFKVSNTTNNVNSKSSIYLVNSSGNVAFSLNNSNTLTLQNNTSGVINLYNASNKGISIASTSGDVTINSVSNSTSASSGGLICNGGAGFGKSVYVGSSFSDTGTASKGAFFTVSNGTFTDNSTAASGTLSGWGASIFLQPTLAAANTGVITTNAYTVYIAGSPLAGANETITNSYGLGVGARMVCHNTTNSTSTTTGCIISQGGIGCAKDIFAANYSTAGLLTLTGNSSGTGINFSGNYSIYKTSGVSMRLVPTASGSNWAWRNTADNADTFVISSTGLTTIYDTTASTNSSVGSVVLSGGLSINNATNSMSSTNGGACTIGGGLGVTKDTYIGGIFDVTGVSTFHSQVNVANSLLVCYGAIWGTPDSSGKFFNVQPVWFTDSSTVSSGTSVQMSFSAFQQPTLFAQNTNVTTPLATTVYIEGAPIAGTNETITESYGLYNKGPTRLDDKIKLKSITAPSTPNSEQVFYVDSSDNLFKSKNTSGTVKTYNPMNSLGDLITHNGTTDVRLPMGTNTQLLISTPSGLDWTTYGSTILQDTTVTKTFDAINNTQLTLTTGVYQDVPFESERVRDDFYKHYEYSNSIELTFLNSGRYIIMTKMLIAGTTGGQSADSQIQFLENTGSGYTFVPGTYGGSVIYNNNSGATSTSHYISDYTTGNSIKLQLQKKSGNNALQTAFMSCCELIVLRVKVDDSLDNSKYLDTYTNANFSLTSSYQNIPFNVNRFINTDTFTHSTNSTDITLLSSGVYFIMARVTTDKTSGTDKSSSDLQLTLNGTALPGTYTSTFAINSTQDLSTGITFIAKQFSANDIVRLQGRLSSFGGTTMETIANGCNLSIMKFQSSSQTNVKCLSIYDATGGTTIAGSYVPLPFTNTTLTHSIYSFTNGGTSVTINETGTYYIFINVTIRNASGSLLIFNNDSYVQIRLLKDTGNGLGFNEITGTNSIAYVSSLNVGTCSLMISQRLYAGTQLQLQAIRSSGNGNLSTYANGTSMTILRMKPTPSLASDYTNSFGSYFQQVSEIPLTSTTNNASFVKKMDLVTSYLSAGTYCLYIAYQINNGGNNWQINSRVNFDQSNTIFDSLTTTTNANFTDVFGTYVVFYLTEGNHIFDLLYKAVNGGNTVGLQDCKLMLWQVGA